MLPAASAAATRSTALRSAASLCHFLQGRNHDMRTDIQKRVVVSVDDDDAAAAAMRSIALRSAASLCHFLQRSFETYKAGIRNHISYSGATHWNTFAENAHLFLAHDVLCLAGKSH
jgi:hypothetical protein